jgi:hypothetical protein
MTDSDYEAFNKMFKRYVEHVSKHPDSLLARVYGIYSLKMKDRDAINLIVM